MVLVKLPSLALNENESVPVKPVVGVYVNDPLGLIVTVPWAAVVEPAAKVNGSPLASVAARVPVNGVFKAVLIVPAVPTGATFTAEPTLTVAVASELLPKPSFALNENVAGPV